jgi:RNA polymerase sigma factor (sigma-70 family)
MLAVELRTVANTLDGLPPAVGRRDLWDDHWVVAKAKSGHKDAFEELYEHHYLKAYRIALRILRNQQDAEDAVQQAFQRAVVNLERFREDSTFSTWFTRIAINEALMLLRQRRTGEPLREQSLESDGGVEIVDDGLTPEELFCQNERYAALHRAIGRLRKNLRVVVLLADLQGLTNAETARRLGLTVSAVKGRLFHARKVLRKHFERSRRGADALNKLKKRKA